MTRGFASAGDALHEFELAVFESDGEDDERVFAAIAGVEEEPICGDGEFGRSVFGGGKVCGDGFDRSVGVDEQTLRSVTEARGGPEIVIEGGINFVDAVDPAGIGMEDDVTRPGAGVAPGAGVIFSASLSPL